ncbi:MAG: hypothetical protein RMN24_08010 [Anaerolineae bacterium]|nr:hypothetical protein [Anaerolineae bacterium]
MRTGLLLLCLALGLGWASPLAAHGGGVIRIAAEPIGPYRLSAWTSPEPPRVGRVHVTVGLADAVTGAAVTNAAVRIVAHGPEGAPPLSVSATHEGALIPELYEADLMLPTPGEWRFTVVVEGTGSADFNLLVREAAPNWTWIGLGGLAIVVLGWMALTSGRRHRRSVGRKAEATGFSAKRVG